MTTLTHSGCGKMHLDLSSSVRLVSVGMSINRSNKTILPGISDVLKLKDSETSWLCMKCHHVFDKSDPELDSVECTCISCNKSKPVAEISLIPNLGAMCEECSKSLRDGDYSGDSVLALLKGVTLEAGILMSEVMFYPVSLDK